MCIRDRCDIVCLDRITVCWCVYYPVTLFELTVVNNWWIIMVSIVTGYQIVYFLHVYTVIFSYIVDIIVCKSL